MKILLMSMMGVSMIGCAMGSEDQAAAGPEGAATAALTSAECSDPATGCVTTAAHDDSFTVPTIDAGNCGSVEYVDYGAGAAGGGNNDDYLVIHHLCGGGHVKAWAWLTRDGFTTYLGDKYNGNGASGPPVIWDPFKPYGNVIAGDKVGLKVCLVSSNDDATPSDCGSATRTSQDG